MPGPLKLLLGPVLLRQGRQVRRQALRLPEPEGPRAGVAGEGVLRLRLLVVGDSAAAGVGVDEQSQALAAPLAERLARVLQGRVSWQLVATTGHRAADALKALEQAPLSPADAMVTSLGVNDAVGQTPVRHWLATLAALHAVAQRRAGVRQTWHSAVPPMEHFPVLPQPLRWVLGRDARRLDQALQRSLAGLSDRHHVALPAMPGEAAGWMARDGFHPGLRGYQAWTVALTRQMLLDGVGALQPAGEDGAAGTGSADSPQLGQ